MATTTSTPSEKGTPSRNTSHTAGKLAPDLESDINIDIRETKRVGFDLFLRLFLSRCLGGKDKDAFENIQSQIEKLRSERLNDVILRTTPRSRPEPTRCDGDADSEAERTLVEERDKLLDHVLDESIASILKVANAPEIRSKLVTFATSIKSCMEEVERYQSYADLYNCVLDELAKLSSTSLRPAADYHLRFCRADPIPIKSTYFNTGPATECKPDFVRVAHSVAVDVHTHAGFGDKPTKGFQWAQVPSCEEVKAFQTSLSKSAQAVFNDSHTFTAERKESGVRYQSEPWETSENTHNTSGSKRARSSMNSASAPSKKLRLSTSAAGPVHESQPQRSKDAHVQLATYAMEMLSYSPGVVHVINTLVVDEYIYIWYYDRQGSICSLGNSIIADFPRFLVLLLAFQRFTAEDWGIVPCLNPRAAAHLKTTQPATSVGENGFNLQLSTNNFIDNFFISDQLQRNLEVTGEYLSHQPHRLSGRSTSVMKSKSNGTPMACKISSPEAQRTAEGKILKIVRTLAKQEASEMLEHLPTHHLSGDFRAGSTLRAQSILGIDPKGYRVMRMLVFDELVPLTSLTDDTILMKAWSDIVACHAFLWKCGIEHGDISLWNMMLHPRTHSGVLNNFDLANLTFIHRVPGNERTGTIPFMALDLLTKQYWNGDVNRYHHHDLEAFIWSLAVVYLGNHRGKLDLHNADIKNWFTPDYDTCRASKADFLLLKVVKFPEEIFTETTALSTLTYKMCLMLVDQTIEQRKARSKAQATTSDSLQINFSNSMWDAFIPILGTLQLEKLVVKHKPLFNSSCSEAKQLFTKNFSSNPST